MAELTSSSSSDSATTDDQKKEELIKKVSERVWQLLKEDLRREQERRGKRFGS